MRQRAWAGITCTLACAVRLLHLLHEAASAADAAHDQPLPLPLPLPQLQPNTFCCCCCPVLHAAATVQEPLLLLLLLCITVGCCFCEDLLLSLAHRGSCIASLCAAGLCAPKLCTAAEASSCALHVARCIALGATVVSSPPGGCFC